MHTVFKFGIITLAAVLIVLSASFYATAALSPPRFFETLLPTESNPLSQEDIRTVIAYRREQMKALSAHYRALEAIFEQDAPFQGQALDHANALITLAQQTQATFPPGTTRIETEGWGAKPSIWEEPEQFAQIITNFQADLTALSTLLARRGVNTAAAEVLQQVRQQCLACHQHYRVRKP